MAKLTSETRAQQLVVKWWRENFPHFHFSLFTTNNEATYAIDPANTMGAMMKAQKDKKKGKVSGVADLICTVPHIKTRAIWFRELKIEAEYQDHQQLFIEEQAGHNHDAAMIRGKDYNDLAEKVIADLKKHMQGYPDFYELARTQKIDNIEL